MIERRQKSLEKGLGKNLSSERFFPRYSPFAERPTEFSGKTLLKKGSPPCPLPKTFCHVLLKFQRTHCMRADTKCSAKNHQKTARGVRIRVEGKESSREENRLGKGERGMPSFVPVLLSPLSFAQEVFLSGLIASKL